MKNLRIRAVGFVFILSSFLSVLNSHASSNKISGSENSGPIGKYIIVLRGEAAGESVTALEIESEAFQLTNTYGGSVKRVYTNALRGFAAEMSFEEAERMSADRRVLFIEEDAEINTASTQTNAPWSLDRIDQRVIPLNTTYRYDRSGLGVSVYVLDTGIRPTHAEFGGRAVAAFDALNDGQNGIDCNGHGTHVAGTIGGTTYGVAKNVLLYGVRVLPCSGPGMISGVITGIDWITANHSSPAVVNMSLSSTSFSNAMDFAINNSIASGVTYVVAAGNNNSNACNYSPARVAAALTVGATGNLDARWSGSNHGPCLDLFAPGIGISSAWHTSDSATATLGGTSMASPHVAGAVALYLETFPSATPEQTSNAIKIAATAGQVTNIDPNTPNRLLFTAPAVPSAATASVEGRVVTHAGRGISGALVTIQRASTGETKIARSNAFGYFRFEELEIPSFYIMTVEHKRHQFENNTMSFMLNEELSGIVFAAYQQ